ncbi:MAG: glycosyltransferase [Pseudomonadota bacterium]|jgi:hypothetical protein|nr:glycosyltransferase [Pseudomonadota bacterium]|tara:strand:+ start:8669 stop:9577 length:909 start_codon:yes stop_codon:yes gene_type:complete
MFEFSIASPHKNVLWYDYRVFINTKHELEKLGCVYKKNAVNRIYLLSPPVRKSYEDVSEFEPDANNIAIIYSHFEKVENLNGFNKVFVPSNLVQDFLLKKRKESSQWFKKNPFLDSKKKLEVLPPYSSLSEKKGKPNLPQCDLCFIGSPRIRPIVEDILPIVEKNSLSFHLYGPGWERYSGNPSAKKFVVAKTIEYDQFADLALASKICLIDHHDTMNEIGAVSHKYIDHLHSGAFLISDRNKDALENYAGVCYQGRRELEELVDFYLKNPVAREEKRRKQLDIAKNYTTSNTAKKLIAHFI